MLHQKFHVIHFILPEIALLMLFLLTLFAKFTAVFTN